MYQTVKEPQNLFDKLDDNAWQQEWKGMPEFVQDKQRPFSEIKIRFANEDDMQEFAKLIGQKLTKKTKSIWYPKLTRGGHHTTNRYVDES